MKNKKEIKVWLKETSQPIVYLADNTYQKGDLFCIVYTEEDGKRKVTKWPINDIFRIVEDY